MVEKGSTLILGIGNSLRGDDGLGVSAANMLKGFTLPDRVEVQEIGTPGIDLISYFQGRRQVILIDAVKMGRKPGEWRCFKPDDVKLFTYGQFDSTHGMDIPYALEIAEALDLLPDELLIYGMEPKEITLDEDLSNDVKAALPQMLDDILNLVLKREE